MKALNLIIQVAGLASIFAVIGFFAESPRYDYTDSDTGVLRVSFVHAAERIIPCTRPSREEMARQPSNRLRQLVCPRGRHPLWLRFEVDGQAIVDQSFPPGGLYGDGPVAIHRTMKLPAGVHRARLMLNDAGETGAALYDGEFSLRIAAQDNVVIDFDPGQGGFYLR